MPTGQALGLVARVTIAGVIQHRGLAMGDESFTAADAFNAAAPDPPPLRYDEVPAGTMVVVDIKNTAHEPLRFIATLS